MPSVMMAWALRPSPSITHMLLAFALSTLKAILLLTADQLARFAFSPDGICQGRRAAPPAAGTR